MQKLKIYILVAIFVSLIGVGFLYLKYIVSNVEDIIYTSASEVMQKKIESLIDEKQKSLMTIVLTLSQYKKIQEVLESTQYEDINLHMITRKLKKQIHYNDVEFQIIDKYGKSFYRSWTDKRGDSLLKARLDIANILRHPKMKSSISVGKFDLSFKSIVPIYKKSVFLGFIESIAKFGTIANELEKAGIKPLFLVDKRYKEQIKFPYTKHFLNDYYVANHTEDEIVQRVEAIGVQKIVHEKYYVDKKSNKLITTYIIRDLKARNMSYMLLSLPLNEIDLSEVDKMKHYFELFIILLSSIFAVLFAYIVLKRK